jgi:transposase
MPRPLAIPPLDEATAAELRRRYETAADPETRLRYQVVWLAHLGRRVPDIAGIVLRSHDTVARVLHRFRAGGLDAVPRRAAPGPARTVTPVWEAELLRVVELSPRAVGVARANWTTGLLAAYLAERTGVAVGAETVRQHLHAHDYVCKRPTWTLERRAGEQPSYVGNA